MTAETSEPRVDPRTPGAVRRSPHFDDARLTATLRDLVETPSVNPGIFEAKMTEKIVGALAELDGEPKLVESLPDRFSVATVISCRPRGPRVVLNGHMDTVGIDDPQSWSSDPFVAEIRGGFLYGRGSCDMKAGLTSQIAVGRYVHEHRRDLRGELVLQFAIGEERGEPGTASLVAAGFGGDIGVVNEPSELNVAIAQRGLAFYEIVLAGRSVHASRPDLGVNPIGRLPLVLELLEGHLREIGERRHQLLPPPTCTPTMVRAGAQPNSLPDTCVLTIDRRFLPGESPAVELEALRELLAEVPGAEVRLLPNSFRPAEVASESPVTTGLVHAVEAMTGRKPELRGAPYATDCQVLVHDGKMDAVVFGPGNPAECHCPDERISLAELRDGALSLAKFTVDTLR